MVARKLHKSHSSSTSQRSVVTDHKLASLRRPGLAGAFVALGFFLCGLPASAGSPAAAGSQGAASADAHAKPRADFGKVPLSFEPNRGQADARVQFLSRGPGYSLFLAPGQAVLSLERQAPNAAGEASGPHQRVSANSTDVLNMQLLGANAAAAVHGLDPQHGVVNYFVGKDPKNWHSGIPTFGKVSYSAVYPGIDLVFYGNQRQLEYDFVVAPGADPNQIAWTITGSALSVDADGNLVLKAANGPASFKKPVIYQMDNGNQVSVDGRYRIAGNQVRFALGRYDRSKPLIIDPILIYATYLGGASEQGYPTSGVSSIGYFTGLYPTGVSNPTQGLAIDSEGDVYVAGYTNATNFPLKNPYQSTDAGIVADYRADAAFVTKFNPEGTKLIYSTYLSGGSDAQTLATAIAVDSQGNAYVVGYTNDGNYPTTSGAFQTICGANWNGSGTNPTRINGCAPEAQVSGFLSKLDPTGQTLIYSTFLGGQVSDQIYGVAVDSQGQAYVTGNSSDYCNTAQQPGWACFPTTAGAVLPGTASYVYQPSLGYYGLYTGNAFITVFDATGSSLLYSSYIGDNTALISSGAVPAGTWGETNGSAVAVDSAGDFFVTGITVAPNMPTTAGAYQTVPAFSGCCQGFVAKFAPITGGSTSLTYLTYLSGPDGAAYPSGIAADSAGEAYVAGKNEDQNYPTTSGAFQTSCGTPGDTECNTAFVTKFNAAGTGLVWSTLLGNKLNGNGVGVDAVGPIQLDANGNVFVTGQSTGYYPDFPQVNPIQPVVSGNPEPFVTEFDPTGSQVLFSTFFGSEGVTWQDAAGMAVDNNGNIYLAGNTNGTGIGVTPGAFQQSFAGADDGYVAKISLEFLPSTTTLTISPNPGTYGHAVTLTAKVKGASGSPTAAGTVTFNNGDTEMGTVTLNGSGTATLTTSSLPAGTYSITADYSGDANFTASTSSVTSLVVAKATPVIVWPAPAAITYGTALGTAQLDAHTGPAGTFVYSPAKGTILSAGTQTLSVTFTPTDTTDYTTATASVTLTVSQRTPHITWPTPAPILYGVALGSAELDASTGPAGTFVYSPAKGTILSAGTQTLSVTFTPTDTTDYTTATASVTLTVNKRTPHITWPTPAAITSGTALSSKQLDASSGVGGTFAYTPPAGTVLSAGTHTLSVTLTPTDGTDYTTATATVTLTVNPSS